MTHSTATPPYPEERRALSWTAEIERATDHHHHDRWSAAVPLIEELYHEVAALGALLGRSPEGRFARALQTVRSALAEFPDAPDRLIFGAAAEPPAAPHPRLSDPAPRPPQLLQTGLAADTPVGAGTWLLWGAPVWSSGSSITCSGGATVSLTAGIYTVELLLSGDRARGDDPIGAAVEIDGRVSGHIALGHAYDTASAGAVTIALTTTAVVTAPARLRVRVGNAAPLPGGGTHLLPADQRSQIHRAGTRLSIVRIDSGALPDPVTAAADAE